MHELHSQCAVVFILVVWSFQDQDPIYHTALPLRVIVLIHKVKIIMQKWE